MCSINGAIPLMSRNITDSVVKDMITLLACYDEAYHNGEPIVSDSEYDTLRREVEALDPTNPYFTMVGSDVRGGKVKLPYPMGSLDQIYDGGVEAWLGKYSLHQKKLVITDKLDGVSIMLVYVGGRLSIAYSRGNGIEGADITRHVKNMPSVPKTVACDYLVVRAEGIMKNATFAEKYADQFSNPRSMVAGAMNRSETEVSVLAGIDCVAYQIVDHKDAASPLFKSKSESLALLRKFGFLVANDDSKFYIGGTINELFLETTITMRRAQSDYELDGIVVSIDEIEGIDSKRNSDTLNPEDSIKYKMLDTDSVVETTVTAVIWDLSKHGFFKPRVEIQPVRLYGTIVTYATGFNAKFISENGVGPGATIKITKSGSVIPYILEVTKAVEPSLPIPEWNWNESGVEAVVSDVDTNYDVKFKQVLDFFETLQVDLLRDASLRKIIEYLKIGHMPYDDIIEIIMSALEVEWVNAIGSNGVKIKESLDRRLENMKMETLLGAVRYMGIGFGVRKARMLLSQIDDDNDVWNLSVSDIEALDGFDTKTAIQTRTGLDKVKPLFDSWTKDGIINIIKEVKTDELSSLNVVMTGFRDAALQAKIESMGGKVGSSVSKKTTHLLCAVMQSGSGKFKKAESLGVKIMTVGDFKDEYNL